MITRRRLTALACAAPALLHGSARAARPLRVAFVNPGRLDEAFWIMAEQTMVAAARNLSIQLEVLRADRDRLRMRELGLSVAARADRPDALVIVNEEESALEVVLAAGQSGLPTLLLVNDLEGKDAEQVGPPRTRVPTYLGSVAPDNVAAGHLLAEVTLAAARHLGADATSHPLHLLAIAGDQITPSSLNRVKGLEAVLREAPDVALDRMLFANWSGGTAKTLAARYVEWAQRSGLQPAAVWAASDAMALGAASAFAEAGLDPGRKVVFGGVNWSREGVKAVADGRMAATVGGHFLCGAWAMVMLRDHFDGPGFEQRGDARVRVPLSAITAASAPRYLDALGDGNWDRIDFQRLRRAPGGEYDFSLGAVLAAVS